VTRGARAWIGLSTLLGACALAGWALPREALDWQPALAFHQPWRAVSAVGVHYSLPHLIANLAGLALAGAFGVVAQVPTRVAGAWLVAWPLTQLGLLARPDLTHYGGLSGVLHAGVAVVVVSLLIDGTRAQRWLAGAVLLGLGLKIANESPWGPALRHPAGWDIAVAPFAHASGALAGALCAIIASRWPHAATANEHD
jgi:rhomboid family GlyGly-CTERM serine protease